MLAKSRKGLKSMTCLITDHLEGIPTATSGITVVRSEERDDPEQKQCRPAWQLERSITVSHAIRCRCCSHPVSAENWPPHGTTFRPAGDIPSDPAVQMPKDLRTKDTERHRGFPFTPEADTRVLQPGQALLSGVGDSYSLFHVKRSSMSDASDDSSGRYKIPPCSTITVKYSMAASCMQPRKHASRNSIAGCVQTAEV
jgi:hypothetical protein